MTNNTHLHAAFLHSSRPHVLQISNHGVHQWHVTPGLPDTGGQNIFVNQLSTTLAQLGYKITIANRGGYAHPHSGLPQAGLHYRDEHQRILYLDDGLHRFVRKEEMAPRLPYLAADLHHALMDEGSPPDLILSHYWDGAVLATLYRKDCSHPAPHYWIPHSLGAIKKRNVAAERWADLHIAERIVAERGILSEADGAIATSSLIRQALHEDYGYTGPDLFLPPCIDPTRFHPREISPSDPVWRFLADCCGRSEEEVRARQIVLEISRTDTTKRKDILLRAFARAHRLAPDSLLVMSVVDDGSDLARKLKALVAELGLSRDVALVGSVWNLLPTLYAVAAIYCTPSIMEGFGMSAQEAAATALPVIASPHVPFVSEYLLGPEEAVVRQDGLRIGRGAIVAPADDVAAFAAALTLLLQNEQMRRRLGERAYHITIPAFTWRPRLKELLAAIGVKPA